eukprot:Em0021g787a
MVGLEEAGKTTILYNLKLGEFVTTIPTIGFNKETITYRRVPFEIWDISGKSKSRPMWQFYQQHAMDAIVFVLDSSDRERLGEAREALRAVLSSQNSEKQVVLVLANKRDLSDTMSKEEIAEKMGLDTMTERSWRIQLCCGVNGDGLYEGLDWIYWKVVG